MNEPSGKVFISYRREETSHLAGRLADELADRYGPSRVFMDIDSISPGADFVEAINQAVHDSAVLLAVIGPRWATLTDRAGRRRLDDPDDFVVREVVTALAAQVPVIPVLADGAEMPAAGELPEQLRPLTRRHAIRLDAVTFRRDTDWLLDQLTTFVPPPVPDTSGPTDDREQATEEGGRHSARRLVSRRTVLGLAATAVVAAATAQAVGWPDRAPASPRVRWVHRTGGEVYSSPRVSDGVAYVGSNDHHLYALVAATGEERWRHPTGGAVTSSPAVGDGAVYVGSNDQSVHAVDIDSGRARWTFPTGGSVHSSPAFADGLVVVGSRDHNVYALDARDGTERWRFAGGDWFNSSPTVADGAVYIGCRDHEIYCLDLGTGAKRWSYTTESTVDSSATVGGTTVWIGGDDGHVYALSTAGSWIWQAHLGGGVVSRPLVVGSVLYAGSDDGHLYAVDASTGRRRWSFPTGNGVRSSPAAEGGVVYVGSRDRSLYAVDAVTGEQRWRFETQGPIDDSSPVVTADLVVVGSLDGSVYAVLPPDGQV